MTHDAIDRISPTLEPDQPVLMYQNWHHLLFLHWEIPPQELQALIPAGLTVDTFEGKAYAGLIPFTMTGVRPVLTPPLPGISSFHEVNVRTYVHREGCDPGVWFFSLDASSTLAVAAARAAYKLPRTFTPRSRSTPRMTRCRRSTTRVIATIRGGRCRQMLISATPRWRGRPDPPSREPWSTSSWSATSSIQWMTIIALSRPSAPPPAVSASARRCAAARRDAGMGGGDPKVGGHAPATLRA